MAYIAKSTIQEVHDKLDAIAVVADYVRLEKRSGRYVGLCPFHQEKTPSFSVNPDLKVYHCFGCGKGGTVINFVMEMDKYSFPETIELLAKRFSIPVVYEDFGGGPEDTGMTRRIEELAELYSRVAGSFHYVLMEKPAGSAAKAYLISRGISTAMIDHFRLGYAPADRRWLFTFLSRKGYSQEFLAASGLFSPKYPGTSFFSDRLMFPIVDRQGRTVAFGGRILGKEGPKYINSAESVMYKKGQTLFAIDLALPAIRKTGDVYIAEGYMDVIALHQAGITNAVAPLGTAFTDEQAKLLRRWAERVYLIFDADTAGQNAAVKAILTCRNNALASAVVVPGNEPPGQPAWKDPADILQEAGPEALQKRVKCSITDFEYLVGRSRSLFDISDAAGKAQAVAFLFPYLKTLDSEVSRDACIGSIAAAFGVDRGAVAEDYRHFGERGFDGNRRYALGNKGSPKPIQMNDELFLLAAVSVHYRLYPQFRSKLSIKEIEDPSAKELFIALEECYVHDESGMDDLLSRITAPELRNFIIERGASNEFSANPEQLVSDGINRVKQRRLKRRLDEIVMELRIAKEGVTRIRGETRLEELLAEKMHLDAELCRLKEET